jgi:hypothetical protein
VGAELGDSTEVAVQHTRERMGMARDEHGGWTLPDGDKMQIPQHAERRDEGGLRNRSHA